MKPSARSIAAAVAATLAIAGCTPAETISGQDEDPTGPVDSPPAVYTASELATLYGGSVWKVEADLCGFLPGGGSGFSIGDGLIATSAHVVEGSVSVTVSDRTGTRTLPATVLGVAEGVDIAVLRVQGDTGSALQWAEPELIEEGSPVVSLSYPSPLGVFSVSSGLVNAIVREGGLPVSVVSDELTDYGSSGGPLLDSRGRVVAIITEFLGGSVPSGVSLTYAAIEDELAAILAGERPYEEVCVGPVYSSIMSQLRELCADQAFWACDELYERSESGSEDEQYGSDCGGAAVGTDEWCSDLFDSYAFQFEEDPTLDLLVERCGSDEDGWEDACDLLYALSPLYSEYEEFGETCGGRGYSDDWCAATRR